MAQFGKRCKKFSLLVCNVSYLLQLILHQPNIFVISWNGMGSRIDRRLDLDLVAGSGHWDSRLMEKYSISSDPCVHFVLSFLTLYFFFCSIPHNYSGGIMLCCGVLTWGSSDEGIFEARLLLLDFSPSTPKIDMFNGDVVECQSQNSNDIEKRKFIFCTTLIMQNNTKSKYSQRG